MSKLIDFNEKVTNATLDSLIFKITQDSKNPLDSFKKSIKQGFDKTQREHSISIGKIKLSGNQVLKNKKDYANIAYVLGEYDPSTKTLKNYHNAENNAFFASNGKNREILDNINPIKHRKSTILKRISKTKTTHFEFEYDGEKKSFEQTNSFDHLDKIIKSEDFFSYAVLISEGFFYDKAKTLLENKRSKKNSDDSKKEVYLPKDTYHRLDLKSTLSVFYDLLKERSYYCDEMFKTDIEEKNLNILKEMVTGKKPEPKSTYETLKDRFDDKTLKKYSEKFNYSPNTIIDIVSKNMPEFDNNDIIEALINFYKKDTKNIENEPLPFSETDHYETIRERKIQNNQYLIDEFEKIKSLDSTPKIPLYDIYALKN